MYERPRMGWDIRAGSASTESLRSAPGDGKEIAHYRAAAWSALADRLLDASIRVTGWWRCYRGQENLFRLQPIFGKYVNMI